MLSGMSVIITCKSYLSIGPLYLLEASCRLVRDEPSPCSHRQCPRNTKKRPVKDGALSKYKGLLI